MAFRQLAFDEMDAAAKVHRASFDERFPWLVGFHSPEEDSRFYRDRVFAVCAVWGAFDEEALVGIIAFREEWIDQLFILPQIQNEGIGTSLLHIAKKSFPCLSLWTFQRNAAGRRFYEANGFSLVKD